MVEEEERNEARVGSGEGWRLNLRRQEAEEGKRRGRERWGREGPNKVDKDVRGRRGDKRSGAGSFSTCVDPLRRVRR